MLLSSLPFLKLILPLKEIQTEIIAYLPIGFLSSLKTENIRRRQRGRGAEKEKNN